MKADMKMKADIEMKKLESDKRVMELIHLGKTQGGFVALSQIEEKLPEAMRRSEERRVGKECRSRWSP